MTCSQCAHYTPDPEGFGGIGLCARDVKRQGLTMFYEQRYGEWETHRQQSLPYPGQVACSEFKS